MDEDSFFGLAGDRGRVVGDFDFFVGHDGVAIRRQGGPGHDLPAMTGLEGFGIRSAGGMKSLDGEGSAIEVGEAKGDAIHGDPVEGRERAVGVEIFAEDAAKGIFQSDGFRFQKSGVGEHQLFGFGRRDQGHGATMPLML